MKLRHIGAANMSAVAIVLYCSAGLARDPQPSPEPGRGLETIEMFRAMESGLIEVDMIGLDATKANLLFKNKTDRPLSIKLPEVFAGVPVLAQDDFGGGSTSGGGAAQTTGGGVGGGGIGGGGGGFFNIAADRSAKLGVTTICLEHGKRDPNPRIDYAIRPLESVTDKPEIFELCKMLGRNEIPQNAAQAAAWHLANGLTWQQLAQKDRFRSQITGAFQKWFSPRDLMFAQRIAVEAKKRAEQLPKDPIAQPVISEQQLQVSQDQQQPVTNLP
jgi:hypothetical protein